MLASHPDATLDPPIQAPAEFARETWTADAADVELVRARLTGLGPATVAAIAASLALPADRIEAALLRLEGEGYVMRGRFSPEARHGAEEWCERHLLARIHRYTLGRLRREIEPVAPRDFMRFLCDWQHVAPAARVSGPEALAGVLAQLEGFEAPASAWESELLRARVADYSIGWLDDLCTAGRIVWARLRGVVADAGGAHGTSLRATPVALLPRRQLAAWTRVAAAGTSAAASERDGLSSRAQRVVDALADHGASFFDDLLAATRLLQPELEDALAEAVARGRVHCDSFAGLRALLVPPSKRPSGVGRRGQRAALFGLQDAGRWTLVRRTVPRAAEDDDALPVPRAQSGEDVEHVARTLLQRYGVVFWRLLEREAAWLPPWRELLRVFHRLEARGEIRGGRFVAGVSGEQFALPQAVGALRHVRDRAADGALVSLSAHDPLNLLGTVLPGTRLPRQAGARLLLRDGVPLATVVAGQVEFTADAVPAERGALRRALLREVEPAPWLLPQPVAGG